MTDIVINDLTEAKLAGTGVFDVLMRATKAHLDEEFSKNRIKGAEYSTVYLGSLESVMRTSLDFLLQKQKISLEAQLMEQQILVAKAEVEKANAQVELMKEQVAIAKVELEIAKLNQAKVPAEIAHLAAQTALVGQQKTNLIAEAANIPKQGQVLDGQVCKLKAEYDNLMLQKDRATAETSLLTQKIVTEKAQTTGVGIDADSILGCQKALYLAQTTGFTRDAEQKVAKLMADTWNVRRTTDEGTIADGTNMLNDATVGRAIKKMLEGVGA